MNPLEKLRQMIVDTPYEHELPVGAEEQSILDSLQSRHHQFHGFLPSSVVELPVDFVQPPTVLEDLA